MIQCSRCGRQLGVNDQFCPDCGEKLVLTENSGSTRQKKTGAQNTQRPTQQTGAQNTQRPTQQTGAQNAQRPTQQAGAQNAQKPTQQTGAQNTQKPTQQTGAQNVRQPSQPNAGENVVKYVYVDKRTGKITGSPHSGKRSEGCLSFLGIAFAAVAIVIGMVAGSVMIAGYFSGRSASSGENVWYFEEDSESDTFSQETSSEEKQ